MCILLFLYSSTFKQAVFFNVPWMVMTLYSFMSQVVLSNVWLFAPFFVPSSAIHSSGKFLFPLIHPPTVFCFLTLILYNASQKCQHFLILQVLLFLLCAVSHQNMGSHVSLCFVPCSFNVGFLPSHFVFTLQPIHTNTVSHCFPPTWVLKFPEVSGTELASK